MHANVRRVHLPLHQNPNDFMPPLINSKSSQKPSDVPSRNAIKKVESVTQRARDTKNATSVRRPRRAASVKLPRKIPMDAVDVVATIATATATVAVSHANTHAIVVMRSGLLEMLCMVIAVVVTETTTTTVVATIAAMIVVTPVETHVATLAATPVVVTLAAVEKTEKTAKTVRQTTASVTPARNAKPKIASVSPVRNAKPKIANATTQKHVEVLLPMPMLPLQMTKKRTKKRSEGRKLVGHDERN